MSISIAFLATSRAIELTVTDDENYISSLLFSGLHLIQRSCHDGDNYSILKSMSVNLQFAKLEQRTYSPWPRHENAQLNIWRLYP